MRKRGKRKRTKNRLSAVELAKKAMGFIELPGNVVHKDKKQYSRKNKHKKANHRNGDWL
jgi:hypothetical protein